LDDLLRLCYRGGGAVDLVLLDPGDNLRVLRVVHTPPDSQAGTKDKKDDMPDVLCHYRFSMD
jgi:hypothetical protein